ncbi:flagellar hook-length control protein FliK [Campylobacter coli]|uniref:Flagellar hook-length control protein FliK n=2 Tax=Campylobacter coli TaxID=195 RepID=A0A644SED6_CAMCO|nr:flagellar hook-length control protein FliK [Campylobacter coli]EAH6860122.1 flagellar hook-length control protein FliK [Campylobacter coli]EAH7176823.1 flagellar hook-length control protein FliK [Campylobacter coli]EAH7181480.1 flagellar hook-length control protein FliK [Campylobacter coli]EAH7501459.1 flagellar hook-length control protein FliK [Campylobacter coli]EAH7505841.1 flagellar hook-length control protein FliK [Campylobacter coli]
MSNLTPSNDILNLTPSKTNTTHSSSSKTKEQDLKKSDNTTQDDTESFLNSLLNSIEETNEFLPDHMKISQKEVVNEAMDKLQNGVFSESDKISIFESASFMQILSLLDKLKADTADIKLANLSTQLSQLVKTEANFNALKSASNLSELLNIAKDLGLNVKNIKVDRLLDLKATFPNLDKANFFKGAVDNVFKEIINNKLAHISKNLNQNVQNLNHTPHANLNQNSKNIKSKDDTSLLSQTLKNLDAIISSKNEKNEVKNDNVKIQTDGETAELKNTSKNLTHSESLKELEQENLTNNDKKIPSQEVQNKEQSKEPKNDKNTLLNESLKKDDKELKNANKANVQDLTPSKNNTAQDKLPMQDKVSAQNKALTQEKIIPQEKVSTQEKTLPQDKVSIQEKPLNNKEGLNQETNNIKNTKDLNQVLDKNNNLNENPKEQVKNENTNFNKTSNKENIRDSQNLSLNLSPKDLNLNKDNKTNNKDNTLKDIKQNFTEQKVSFENLNKTQFVSNKDNTNFTHYTNKENYTQEQGKIQSENTEKNPLDDLNSLVKDLNKISQSNTKNITPKETLQHFSQDLKAAMEQYKAPITKLSITLNPHNLGEVEVTLVQRGNNLHINFNSNTNAMNLFIQNQAEFKNSLVNMGFTGLEMNFSDQGKREQNQNQGKNRSGYGFKDALEGKTEGEKINLELVLAKYF